MEDKNKILDNNSNAINNDLNSLDEINKENNEEQGSIVINKVEKKKSLNSKFLGTLGWILLILLISLLSSYIVSKKYISSHVDAALTNITGEDADKIVKKVYDREDWRKIYDSGVSNVVGVGKNKEAFMLNNYNTVTTGFVMDDKGNIAIPLSFIDKFNGKLFVKVVNKYRETILEANVIAKDPLTGIAIINGGRIDIKNRVLFEDKNVKLGQTIIIVGAPFGSFETGNLVAGNIQAKVQPLIVTDDNKNQIKVNAAIASMVTNKINDSGVCLSMDGKVLGMVSNFMTNKMGLTNSAIIIPVNELNKVTSRLAKNDTLTSFEFGVEGNILRYDPLKREAFYVLEVKKDSTAHRGGILPTDLIVSIDGKAINANDDINSYIKGKKVGEIIVVQIERMGKILNLSMKIY